MRGRAERRPDKGQINQIVGEKLDQMVGVALRDFVMDSGMKAGEGREPPRHRHVHGRGDDAQPERAGVALCAVLKFPPGILRQAQNRLGPLIEQTARVGELDLAGAAQEERRADLLLELLHLETERRLCHGEPARGGGDGSLVGDGAEFPELLQFHGRSFLRMIFISFCSCSVRAGI